jgi:hypothetical protein
VSAPGVVGGRRACHRVAINDTVHGPTGFLAGEIEGIDMTLTFLSQTQFGGTVCPV